MERTMMADNVWRPELALNGRRLCVRYVYQKDAVVRDVVSQHGGVVYFDTARAAQEQCDLLNTVFFDARVCGWR